MKRLRDEEWNDLLTLAHEGNCTPIIGAGASAGILPLGAELAEQLADNFNYPLKDKYDLSRVSQYLAIQRYDMFPKDQIRRSFQDKPHPDYSQKNEIHGVLADLQLPIYITTNYDNFMVKAIESRNRLVKREYCRWNNYPEVIGEQSVFETDYKPDTAQPLVYHLHGHYDLPQSMVLTEDDYLDFLIKISENTQFLPSPILRALAGTSLLFVGYSLSDWNFRVLLRGITKTLGRSTGFPSIAIQLPPGRLSPEDQGRAEEYLEKYLETIHLIKLRVYWGNVKDFAYELRDRWENFKS